MSFKLVQDKNILIDNGNDVEFAVDPVLARTTKAINLVTHAHLDHIKVSKSTADNLFLGTKPTIEVMQELFDHEFNFDYINYNKKLKYGDMEINFRDSGHVLGSASIDFLVDGNKVSITSDLNIDEDLITMPAIPEETDHLIIESTYGTKETNFPDRDEELKKLVGWLHSNIINNKKPILLAYSFGKAQELIKLINNETDFYIGVNERTNNIADIYNKNGIELKNYFKLNGNLNECDILILPPNLVYNRNFMLALEYNKVKPSFASITGQSFRSGTNFKISNHSDISKLLGYIQDCNPKKVYTYHGDAEGFAKIIYNILGIKGEPLKNINF
jgi:putative mRNA 3-end processing factor